MQQQRSLKLQQNFTYVRDCSEQLTRGLTEEDMVLQSMPDASPTKWHLAHTSWFFEEFILKSFAPNHSPYNEQYCFLFNSYYEAVGSRHQRPLRGMLSRPSLQEILGYRTSVNERILQLLDSSSTLPATLLDLVELGLHHEMQHQELLLTDVLHALSVHPYFPAVKISNNTSYSGDMNPLKFISYDEGLIQIGTDEKGFHYDCEGPKHSYYQNGFELSNRLINNREWLDFVKDKGYQTATLWLSDGWARRCQENWQAPLYWHKQNGEWFQFGLDGLQPVDLNAPVCHISYYEADAFASWAGYRLPTEQEWEHAAQPRTIKGNFLEQEQWRPRAPVLDNAEDLPQLYGDVWQWTQSPFSPYPGFRIAEGAVGEYNGKFMDGQRVLKGGSCVTPIQQIRPTYRNFFHPHQRWQYSGLRLAKDQ